MTTSATLIILAAIVGAAIFLAFLLTRLGRKSEAERERAAGMEARLNLLQESVERARQESQRTVSDEVTKKGRVWILQ